MTLTPEQFNKIALKEDVNKLEISNKEVLKKLDLLINAVDSITKNYENHQTEHVANISAHDRFEVRITKLEESLVK